MVLEQVIEAVCPKSKWYKWPLIVLSGILTLVFLFFLANFVFIKIYENKIYPGVYVGGYHIGGMTKEELRNFTEQLNDRLAREGFEFSLKDSRGQEWHKIKISNVISTGDNAVELINFKSGVLADIAYKHGRTGNRYYDFFAPLYFAVFKPTYLQAPLEVDKIAFIQILRDNFSSYADKPGNANFIITNLSPLKYEIIKENSGKDFDYEKVYAEIKNSLSAFVFKQTAVEPHEVVPSIVESDLEGVKTLLPEVLSYGPLSLNYIDPQTNIRKDWEIPVKKIAEWIEVDKNSGVFFKLNEDLLAEFLKVPQSYINKPFQDAKFKMENNRVVEFQASHPGVKLDSEQTIMAINKAFIERNFHSKEITKTVSAIVSTTDPNIKLSDVNNLGLTDVIGAGYSTFRDSHSNRIKNIANAVKRLNGVLIAPDEIFSTNKYAGPYTLENGFLPEEVIKGSEIKKEVGGGMCQIGTTMFRAAMNSGFDITERRNHSLVVNYYADPVNGNPGTDATLYEPLLDLKFKNDTGNYLLLQTEIDFTRQELKFTIWGKPDGRKGWYTHPLVLKWVPAGEAQEILTDKLPLGEKKCQNAFRGAQTSFTYSRVTPDGQKIDRVFESNYRPLPKICLVGTKTDDTQTSKTEECVGENCANSEIPSVIPVASEIPSTTQKTN